MARPAHGLVLCEGCGSRLRHTFSVKNSEGRLFCNLHCWTKHVRLVRKQARWEKRRAAKLFAV